MCLHTAVCINLFKLAIVLSAHILMKNLGTRFFQQFVHWHVVFSWIIRKRYSGYSKKHPAKYQEKGCVNFFYNEFFFLER